MLKLRIASAAVMAPIALAAVWSGGLAFGIMAGLAASAIVWEWQKMVRGQIAQADWLLIALCGLGGVISVWHPLVGLLLVLLGAGLTLPLRLGPWGLSGVLYAGVPIVALVWLRGADEPGRFMLIWLLLVVWATDTAAYAAGRSIGGPLLAPKLSPKKTWAGLLGGMVGAALVGLIMADASQFGPNWMLALIAAVLAVVGQIGDLFESWVKRRWNVKDSSRLIPGHGGVMDRVDGLLAVGLVAALGRLLGL